MDSSSFLHYALGVAPPRPLSDRTRERMALRFKALGEPMRLKILERLFRSPASVSEILTDIRATQANVSKHLAVLRSGGLVRRKREGNRTVYWISDPSIERLCAVVCDAVGREALEDAKALAMPAPKKAARR